MSLRPRRRTARLTASVALVVAAMALAACATTRPSEGANGQLDNGANRPAPGVTANTVTVGFEVDDLNKLHKDIGFTGVDTGSYQNLVNGVNGIVAYVNAHGGLGGRTMKAIIPKPDYTGIDAECRGFTQDTPVFAVVLTGAFDNSTRPCYIAARTTMIDLTPLAHDQAEFDADSPYLWAPDQPELGAFVKAEVQSLAARGWFAGSKGVAVVTPDAEVSRRVSQSIVVPELKSVGVTKVDTYYIDATGIGTLGATIDAALQGTRDNNLDRVFVVGGARIMGIMISDSTAAQLHVKYAISTVDLPEFVVDNPTYIVPGVTNGMAGLGYSVSGDLRLSNVPFPNPANSGEVLCKKIVDGAGAAPPQGNRENYSSIFPYCDAILMMKAAFDKAPAGDITPDQFRDGVWSIGNSLQLSIPNTTSWQPGSYTAASSARPLAWEPNCVLPDRPNRGCFQYVGPAISLVSPGGATPFPTITVPSG